MMKAVFMAGGRGTRISSVASDIPKPMITIQGKPILEHEIECLKQQGYRDIIITVSYLSDVIVDYFGDGSGISAATGEPFGVNIRYFFEDQPLGNAGALLKLRDELKDDFLLLNADVLFDIDIDRMREAHRNSGALATILTHPNSHPYDSGLIVSDSRHIVTTWLTKEEPRPVYYKNRVNAGIHILSPRVLEALPVSAETIGTVDKEGKVVKLDLDRDILRPLAGTGKLCCYDSTEYVRDMGTPERYQAVCHDYAAGLVTGRNLKNAQKAIFLDRDGTINRYVGFLRDIDDFELLGGVGQAIALINQSAFLTVVVTNQPVIARGEVTEDELSEIHRKMETLLGEDGAYVDDLYYCPHHPHKGYAGEVESLKIDCECRKPKPGMLRQAAKDHHIDLSASWMIGDSESDILAGKAAGCRTAYIGSEDYGQDVAGDSLLDVVKQILGLCGAKGSDDRCH